MTPTEFESLGLEAGDKIEVLFQDGSSERYLLYNEKPTGKSREKSKYLTGETVPRIPSKIIVQDKATGGDAGIILSTIIEIKKVQF